MSKPQPPAAPQLPANWPAGVRYLTKPAHSPRLTEAHLRALRTRPADPPDPLPEIPRHLPPGPCPAVRIVPITDPAHPAHGQAGLFATRDLAPGSLILPYLGEVHIGTPPFGRPASGERREVDNAARDEPISNSDPSQEDPDCDDDDPAYDYAASDYDLWLDRDADLAVDAARAGNEARFVNDYRGVPPSPPPLPPLPSLRRRQWGDKKHTAKTRARANAEFRVAWDPRVGERCMAVFVLPAGKKAVGRARTVGIAAGEEVLVSYGRGFWEGRRGDLEGEGY